MITWSVLRIHSRHMHTANNNNNKNNKIDQPDDDSSKSVEQYSMNERTRRKNDEKRKWSFLCLVIFNKLNCGIPTNQPTSQSASHLGICQQEQRVCRWWLFIVIAVLN